MLNQPLQSSDIFQCFDQLVLTGAGPVVVAISGGSDSTALLVGLQGFFKNHNISDPIVAVTIDHGLRPEAEQEAEQVSKLCKELGVEHIIRKWTQNSTASGIQAAAREARYDLIGNVADELGAQFVLTGHTLDDQLETVSMRALRGRGRGLAGIPPATLFRCSTWFVRPLLGVRRTELREYLHKAGIRWVDDPSNQNLDFERVRIRENPFSDSERHQIIGVQSAAKLVRESAAAAGARLILNSDILRINQHRDECRLRLEARTSEGFEAALQTLMSKIGRRSHFASFATMNQILDYVKTGSNGEKFTAHGCLLTINAGDLVVSVEDRTNADGVYCFDYLLPSTDFALASALNLRWKGAKLASAPIKVATR